MKDLLGTMEAESVNIEKVEVADRSAIALVTGVKNQEYEKMNFMDVRLYLVSFCYAVIVFDRFIALRDCSRSF